LKFAQYARHALQLVATELGIWNENLEKRAPYPLWGDDEHRVVVWAWGVVRPTNLRGHIFVWLEFLSPPSHAPREWVKTRWKHRLYESTGLTSLVRASYKMYYISSFIFHSTQFRSRARVEPLSTLRSFVLLWSPLGTARDQPRLEWKPKRVRWQIK